MSDEFAPPPAPGGVPSVAPRREDFRPQAPARRRRRFPRWVAVVLGIGLVAIVGGIITQLLLTARADNVSPASRDTTGRLHSAQVVSGMCIEELGGTAGAVNVVDCADPHSAEAVTAFTFDGDDWKGDGAVEREALAFCASQLAPGAPLAAAAEGRSWVAWVPSQSTWGHGDRTALCIVVGDEAWTGRAGEAGAAATNA